MKRIAMTVSTAALVCLGFMGKAEARTSSFIHMEYDNDNKVHDLAGAAQTLHCVEGWFWDDDVGDFPSWVATAKAMGANCMRVQTRAYPDVDILASFLDEAYRQGMIAIVCADGDPLSWVADRSDVLDAYAVNTIVDVSIEDGPDPDDGQAVIDQWVSNSKDLISQARAILPNNVLGFGTLSSGRYLRGILDHGSEILAADRSNNSLANWQGYWPNFSGPFTYQEDSGFNRGDEGLTDAQVAASQYPVNVMVGMTGNNHPATEDPLSYELMLNNADNLGQDFAFWEMRDPDGDSDPNTLLTDQLDPNARTELGNVVIPFMQDHPGTTPQL